MTAHGFERYPGEPNARVLTAYDYCEAVTRREARNFSYGIRLLPVVQRRALSAVYALARRIDDIGDGGLPAEEALARLDRVREQLTDPAAQDDPVYVALSDAAARRPLPLDAFGELIEGAAMDIRGTTYTCFDDLQAYCTCVAGSIGRLSVGVFGVRTGRESDASARAAAAAPANALGVALQLTNILRDLREDRLAGRGYLPKEDLARFGVDLELDAAGRLDVRPDAFAALVRYEAGRAAWWYAQGAALLPMLDRRSAACTAAMAGIYRRLLTRLVADPEAIRVGRLSVPTTQKLAVAVRALLGAGL